MTEMFRLACLILLIVAASAQRADQRAIETRVRSDATAANNGRAQSPESIVFGGANGISPAILGSSNAIFANDIILPISGLMPALGGLGSRLDLGGLGSRLDLGGLGSRLDLGGLGSRLDLGGLGSRLDLGGLDGRLMPGRVSVSGGQIAMVGGSGVVGNPIRVAGGNAGRIQRGNRQPAVLRNGRFIQASAGFGGQRVIQNNGAVPTRLIGVAGIQPRAMRRATFGGVAQRIPGLMSQQILLAGNGGLPRGLRAQGAVLQGNAGALNNFNGLNGLNTIDLAGLNGFNRLNGLNSLNGLGGLNSLNGLNGLNGQNGLVGWN